MTVDHIAFLTNRLETVAESLPGFCAAGPIEYFPGEGTREQYVEVEGINSPKLLLIQPAGEGPYLNAIQKRGPGLHHIGCITKSIKEMVPHLSRHRLLLHPVSIDTVQNRTVWLCRPEVPFLIEVSEKDESAKNASQARLLLPSALIVPGFINGFFANLDIGSSDDNRFQLSIGTRNLFIEPS